MRYSERKRPKSTSEHNNPSAMALNDKTVYLTESGAKSARMRLLGDKRVIGRGPTSLTNIPRRSVQVMILAASVVEWIKYADNL